MTVIEATSIGPAGATFHGTVIPNGLPTECWFEYGTDPRLGTYDNTSRLPVDPGAPSQDISYAVSGLASGTVYYYRICASNSLGVTPSPIVGFTTRACLQCHGGVDGSQPGVNGAPVVTRYWRTSGHGRGVAAPPLRCDDCHDVGTPVGAHATDGSGTLNTLGWPGKEADTTNTNTAHLKSFFFPDSPVAPVDFPVAFDNACGNRPGCHAMAGGGRLASVMNHAKGDNVMEFGNHGTTPDPKLYRWYSQNTYAEDFYKSQSPWLAEDLATDAAGSSHYGTCISCHDPHGTGSTDQTAAVGNAMVRGNWATDAGQFCSGACHR